jgi:hypothetical protein
MARHPSGLTGCVEQPVVTPNHNARAVRGASIGLERTRLRMVGR